MKNFLIKLFVNLAALLIVIYVLGGVSVDSWRSVIIAALVLGLLNAFLRPAIILLTLPLNVLTLGSFTLVINGLMFYLTSKFVKGFNVINFWNAFWAALLFSVISFLLNVLLSPGITIRMGSYGYKRPHMPTYDNVIDVKAEIEDRKGG